MIIFKPVVLVKALSIAVATASPLDGGRVKRLNVRDLLPNNRGLEEFVKDVASRRKMKRDDVVDTIQVDYVVLKRGPNKGETSNDAVGRDMLQSVTDICVQAFGIGRRALEGRCLDEHTRSITCGDPLNLRWSQTTTHVCQEPRPICKEFRASNFKAKKKTLPICQEKELTDDSSTSTQWETKYVGIWSFPTSPGTRQDCDIWAQTDGGLKFDWTYSGSFPDGTSYSAHEPETSSFTANAAPDNGKLVFSHLNNIAAAYIYWSPHSRS